MALVAGYPEATAFVEIKDESIEQWGLELVMSKLQKVLEPHASQCVIIGCSFEALQLVRQKNKYRTGWVLMNFETDNREKAEQLKPGYIICNYKKVSDELWPGNWSWMLYDIIEPELALQWAERGAELIETAEIGEMLEHERLQKESCKHGL